MPVWQATEKRPLLQTVSINETCKIFKGRLSGLGILAYAKATENDGVNEVVEMWITTIIITNQH